MQEFSIIAFTHKSVGVDQIGRLHLDESERTSLLVSAREVTGADELMYLSTCNRVEFLVCSENQIDLHAFFKALRPGWTADEVSWAASSAQVFEGEEALSHLFAVAASLDSLVVGEREIITQVRNAFEQSQAAGITGDTLRIIVRKTIETAKAVYTHTGIARNPVSVVSLAWRRLRELNVPMDARFLIIGAGVTNSAMAKYLKKHGFSKFKVFNRSITNAEKLAAELKGDAFALDALADYRGGFDVIVTCTAAEGSVITPAIYRALVGDDRARKVVIDLAVPNDLDSAILEEYDINLIAVNNLQEVARQNLRERENELEACRRIISESLESFRVDYRTRQVERAMSDVPKKVKEIRETAVNDIFAREIEQLDDQSKELLDRVMAYMEKKYISVPMKMAREILIEDAKKN
ncbi:MAG: glutamyl-tRNA reductase [Bacteroidetes bacterium]|nr:MAG: glutamyl-tRNA reductase [Bacteroidota bacterium]